MGKIDARTHEYLSDNVKFADIINYFIYNGEQIISPNQLHEMDTSEIAFPYKEGESSEIIQRFRDILKYACMKTDEKTAYLILGMENQSFIQYAMPVKNLLYDAEQYAKQVVITAKKHSKDKTSEKITSGEFLTGFYKDDKLIPVITIVIFWSSDVWDGPMSLHEMMKISDKHLLRLIPDYRINLVAPYNMNNEDFDKLKTTISEAFKFIKYSKDKNKLIEVLNNDSIFQDIDRETAELIRDVTGTSFNLNESEDNINMCVAINQMIQEEKILEAIEIYREYGESDEYIINKLMSKFKVAREYIVSLLSPQNNE